MNSQVDRNEITFLKLFYDVLFLPSYAREEIKLLREYDSTRLFFYAVGIILFSALGLSAIGKSLNILIPSIIFWLFTVIFFGVLAWLFRPKEITVDLGLLFFFCAFAQTPLIFLGLGKLWEHSAFPTTGPTIICLAWSIILWGWSLNHALGIGKLKSAVLIVFALLAPFLFLAGLMVFLFVSLLASLV
jgi:hypothetical protein